MPEEGYLPPVITTLDGNIRPLAEKLAEGEALVKEFGSKTEKSMGDSGAKAGKKGGESLIEEYRKAVKAGATSAGTPEFDMLAKRIENEFRKAGKKGGEGLWQELRAEMGSGKHSVDNDLFRVVAQQFTNFGKKGGMQAGDAFEGGFLSSLMNIGKAGAPALVPAAALLATQLGAMISGAGTTVAGGAWLAGGIVGAFRNPQVKSAAQSLGHDLMDTFTQATSGFVSPVEKAISHLDEFVKGEGGSLKAVFDPLAAAVLPIEHGIEGLVKNALPELAQASRNAEPVLEEVGRQLPGFGKAIGDLALQFTRNIGANKAAIGELFQIVDKGIEAVGTLIEAFDKVYVVSVKALTPMAHFEDAVLGWIPGFHGARAEIDAANKAIDSTTGVTGLANTAITAATTAVEKMNQSVSSTPDILWQVDKRTEALNGSIQQDIIMLGDWGKMFDTINGKAISLQQATDQFDIAIGGLTQDVEKNGTALKGNSAKAAENREAFVGLIQSANQAAQATYDKAVADGHAQTAAADAAKVYRDMTQRILDAASAAGYDTSQVKDLIDQLGRIPKDTYSTVHVRFTQEGDRGGLHSGPIAQRYGGIVPQYAAASGLIAGGGIAVAGSRPAIQFAEPGVGREGFVPERGISDARFYGLVSEIASWRGMEVVPGGGGRSGGVVQIRIPVTLNGRQIAVAAYEDFVNFGQERKNRRGSTGF